MDLFLTTEEIRAAFLILINKSILLLRFSFFNKLVTREVFLSYL